MLRVLAVTNMYPTPQAPAVGTFIEQQVKGLKGAGLSVEVMYIDRAQKGMSAYLGLAPKIRAQIEAFAPDIVHVMYGGIMADMVTRYAADIPAVVTFHGSDLLGENLSGRLRKLIAGYGVRASWKAARRANGIVVVSKLLQDALPPNIDRSKVKIIPCGIDLERFKPLDRDSCCHQLGWDANRFHILFPANSGDPVKRPELARQAVEALEGLRIEAELHQLRGVPNDKVPVWLNACNAVLLTSLHEGSPTIVKEALACNLPVVSVDVGDVRERMHEIAGCYIALPEPNDLALKLRMVHDGSPRIAGRSKMQELSLESIALRLKNFYNEILIANVK